MSKDSNIIRNGSVEDEVAETPCEENRAPAKKTLLSRRKVLGLLGFQVAAGAIALSDAVAAPRNFKRDQYNRKITPAELPNSRAWLVTDPTTCVGCRTCEIVCSLGHDDVCQPALSRIHTVYDPLHSLAKLCVMPDACKQCNMADCYLACEYDALILDKKTGARVIDPKLCQGCGECYEACPWEMVVYNEDKGIYSKCDLCGGDPQCVEYCPAGAIKFIQLS